MKFLNYLTDIQLSFHLIIKNLFLNFLLKSILKTKKSEWLIVIIILFFIFLANSTQATNQALLIVEVQIAGDSSDNDFIKIYNQSDNSFDISGYKLKKRSSNGKEYSIIVIGKTQANFRNTIIPARGYFLWANSKDDFYSTIRADVWSKATLARNNSIALLNPEGLILDALAWGESQNPFVKGSPFPENPVANQQLKRKKANGNYQNTNNNNQDFYLFPSSESAGEKTPQQIESSSKDDSIKEKVYPSGIIINKILPNAPLGIKEEEGEYIEILNQNVFEVDLSDWKIEDIVGKTTTYIFPKGTKIKPLGFLVLSRPVSKITLNNDGDGLNLIQPDGKIVDSVKYEKAPSGQSYNRIGSEWSWQPILTSDSTNIILDQKNKKTELLEEVEKEKNKEVMKIDINTASSEELQKIADIGPVLAQRIIEARPFSSLDELSRVKGIGEKTLEKIKNEGLAWVDPKLKPSEIEKTELSETALATIAKPLQQNYQNKKFPKFLFVFLTALIIAIFSGVIILFLKNKLKKNYNKNL